MAKGDTCEVCGTTEGRIYGKTNKFGVILCNKHYLQMERFGEIKTRTTRDKNEFITDGDIVTVVVYNKNNSEVAKSKFNKTHLDKIIKYKWGINNCGYVVHKSTGTLLHRLITDCEDGVFVDHIDHDTLNNTDENLRKCSRIENSYNQKKRISNKSGFIGVFWYSPYNKWKAVITVNKKQIHLGYFTSIDEAVKVRKEAEIKYHGEFAYKGVV